MPLFQQACQTLRLPPLASENLLITHSNYFYATLTLEQEDEDSRYQLRTPGITLLQGEFAPRALALMVNPV